MMAERGRRVTRLSITPVKSTALHHPDRIHLETWGARGNRVLYWVDENGALYTGAKHGPLVRIVADLDAVTETLSLDIPGRGVVTGSTVDFGERVITDFYGRYVHGREVLGPFADAVSGYAGARVRLVRPDRDGDANDVWPATILSRASAEELARRSERPEPRDSRRFRMLIEIDGCEPHEEDTWIGARVRIGEAVLRVPDAVPRCVITTQDPGTGVRDFPTLKAISAYRGRVSGGIPFGVYGEVMEPGDVAVGDRLEPLGS